jgi:hypothetical protein
VAWNDPASTGQHQQTIECSFTRKPPEEGCSLKKIAFCLTALLLSPVTAILAQDADAWRGGWMADIDGERHIIYVVLRNDNVSGIHCYDCTNPGNLALIDDGILDPGGLEFSLYHYPRDAAPWQETVSAVLEDGELRVTFNDEGRGTLFHRTPPDQRQAAPVAEFRGNRPVATKERVLPGEPELVSADNVIGTWLWGTGPAKQYFFFMEHRGGIRGMVCGPCDTVHDVAPLEQISMEGTNLHFEIVHEDNGGGFEQYGPFSNVTDAVISRNEMHMTTYSSWMTPENARAIEMTLLGPVDAAKYYRSGSGVQQ